MLVQIQHFNASNIKIFLQNQKKKTKKEFVSKSDDGI